MIMLLVMLNIKSDTNILYIFQLKSYFKIFIQTSDLIRKMEHESAQQITVHVIHF